MAALASERRLAAILAADVVGYSRLVEADEAGTLAAIRKLRSEIIDPLLNKLHGRVVKLMGDGAIAEFGSAVDAVRCAIAIQNECTALQDDTPAGDRIVFRIGINLGDVIVEGDDLLGDGVNVAARLEQLCEPGGVLISGTAYDHLQGKLDLPLDFAGEQHVKNISRPVRTYRVRLNGRSGVWRLRARPHWGRMRMVAASLVGLLLLGGGLWWLQPVDSAIAKPGIAVLPFNNFGGDAKWARFANGIIEDIITDLSRSRDLTVIARNSTEVYKGKPIDVRQVGQDLGVRYVLEGSLQSDGDQIRVTAQLIEASTGTHVWSERYDRPATDLFTVQDDITQRISATLLGYEGQLSTAERAAALTKTPAQLQAYDYYLLGVEQKHLMSKEGVLKAREFYNKALQIDPAFQPAIRDIGMTYGLEIDIGVSQSVPESIENHRKFISRALQLDPTDPMAVYQLSMNYMYRGELSKAKEQNEKALMLGASNADILLMSAWSFPQFALTDRAETLADQAVRLNPHFPDWYQYGLRFVYLFAQNFEKALAAQLAIGDTTTIDQAYLAMIYAQLGEEDSAARAAMAVRKSDPNWSAEQYASDLGGFAGEAEIRVLVESATKAGIPACLTSEQLENKPDTKRLKACDQERAQS